MDEKERKKINSYLPSPASPVGDVSAGQGVRRMPTECRSVVQNSSILKIYER